MENTKAKRHELYDYVASIGGKVNTYAMQKLKKLMIEYAHLDMETLRRDLRLTVERNTTLRKSIKQFEDVIKRRKESDSAGISIDVYQHDWIPGFAAFFNNGNLKKRKRAHVCLNLGSCLLTVAKGDLKKEELAYLIAETIMHEVVHVLESWAEVEFNEDKVHALIEKYNKKYKHY